MVDNSTLEIYSLSTMCKPSTVGHFDFPGTSPATMRR
jgi:hypothetical protein